MEGPMEPRRPSNTKQKSVKVEENIFGSIKVEEAKAEVKAEVKADVKADVKAEKFDINDW